MSWWLIYFIGVGCYAAFEAILAVYRGEPVDIGSLIGSIFWPIMVVMIVVMMITAGIAKVLRAW